MPFLPEAYAADNSMNPAIIMLAKLGDIINVLPIARDLHLKGMTPTFYHYSQYSTLFRGVDYAHSESVLIKMDKLDLFAEGLREKHSPVLVAQSFGPAWKGGYAHAHNIRSWLNCGYSVEQFYDVENFPLVFQRDDERERFLLQRNVTGGKPLVVLALKGLSSPFASHDLLERSLRTRLPQCEVVSLAKVKAGRFYDMLGFLDAASALVTVDTSMLHLAVASKVPVISLMGDDTRTAAQPRKPPMLTVKYSEWRKRLPEIDKAIRECLHQAYGPRSQMHNMLPTAGG